MALEFFFKQIGDPGGEKELRDGFLFSYDHTNRIPRYSFEEVDKRCVASGVVRHGRVWFTDKLLSVDARLNRQDVCLGSPGWHFAHLVCWSYHSWNESRKIAASTTTVGCIQNAVVNGGPWNQLEISFKFLSLAYRVFIISATVISPQSELMGKRKKILRADAFLKIAVGLTNTCDWYYDAYLIPNLEISNKSPAQYRVSLQEVNAATEFRFLGGIEAVVQQRNLYDEGNIQKHRWLEHNAPPVEEAPGEPELFQDSAIGMDSDSQAESLLAAVEEPSVDPKDLRIAALEAQVVTLKTQLAAREQQLLVATKRKYTKRDSNAPKRPSSAFLMFHMDERAKVKWTPQHTLSFVSKEVSRRWDQADPQTRERYNLMAEEDKQRYRREMISYNNNKQAVGGADPVKTPNPKAMRFDDQVTDKNKPDKDSGKPKGRRRAYDFYVHACKVELRKRIPKPSVSDWHELTRGCGQRWKEMPVKGKAPFRKQAEVDMQRYQKEMAAYNNNNTADGGAAPVQQQQFEQEETN